MSDWTKRYHLLKQIGEGSFCKVWMAEKLDASHPPQVTLHQLEDSDFADGSFSSPSTSNSPFSSCSLTQFSMAEKPVFVAVKVFVKAMMSFKSYGRMRKIYECLHMCPHPSVVTPVEVYEDEENLVLVEELVPNGDLLTFCTQKKKLDEEEVKLLAWKILEGVDHLHSLGIVHRDIKLENILLTTNGEPKLTDFNLSNFFMGDEKLTSFCGSPAYCAPEIFLGIPYQGPEIDTWAVGVVIYCMLYKYFPFSYVKKKEMEDEESIGPKPQLLAIFDRVKKGLSSPRVGGVSSGVSCQAKHLLSYIFKISTDDRPTLKEIMRHPWFDTVRPSPEGDVELDLSEILQMELSPALPKKKEEEINSKKNHPGQNNQPSSLPPSEPFAEGEKPTSPPPPPRDRRNSRGSRKSLSFSSNFASLLTSGGDPNQPNEDQLPDAHPSEDHPPRGGDHVIDEKTNVDQKTTAVANPSSSPPFMNERQRRKSVTLECKKPPPSEQKKECTTSPEEKRRRSGSFIKRLFGKN